MALALSCLSWWPRKRVLTTNDPRGRRRCCEAASVLRCCKARQTFWQPLCRSLQSVQASFSVSSPPQIVVVRQKITTRFSIIPSVIGMLNVAMSELKGQTALNHVLLLHRSSVFCKANSLPNSVGFSPHLQERHVGGIYLSLMSFKCVRTTSFIMAVRTTANP